MSVEVSEHEFKTLFEEAPVGMAHLSLDGQQWIRMNKRFCAILGLEGAPLHQISFSALYPEAEDSLADIAVLQAHSSQPRIRECCYFHKKGHAVWVRETFSLFRETDGSPRYYVITIEDISEQKRIVLELIAQQEQYELAGKGSNDGLWDWRIPENTVYYSSRFKQLLGYAEEEFPNTMEAWLDSMYPDERPTIRQHVIDHLKGYLPHLELELRMLHSDGEWRWVLVRGAALYDAVTGQAYRVAGSLTDITKRKLTEQALIRDATYDAVTQLPNRQFFTARLEEALASHLSPSFCAVLLLNIERFSSINNNFGHVEGDAFLAEMGRRIISQLKPRDTVARFSADEFAILLHRIHSVEEAYAFAESLIHTLSKRHFIQTSEIFPSARIGIALSSNGYTDSAPMLRDANTAMLRAKKQPHDQIAIFDHEMHASAVRLLKLDNALRYALERKEFIPFFQPIVHLDTLSVMGFEALVRWKHPERGIVAPGEFILAAEELNLISPIGDQVLVSTCEHMKAWEERLGRPLPIQVSVNLSGKQFQQPRLVENILLALKETGIPNRYLKLEITESALIENSGEKTPSEMLQALRDAGILILLDDFGTGLSSLSYLHQFPIDIIKIDSSFTRRLENEDRSLEIVRAIIMLAHNLGMKVVAEGIETQAQLMLLVQLNCDYGQGYYFSRPLPGEAAYEWFSTRPAYSELAEGTQDPLHLL